MFFNRLFKTFISCCISIVPILAIIILLHWTGVASLVDLNTYGYGSTEWFNQGLIDTGFLLLGGFILILGLALFTLGCDSSLSKVGEHIGANISRQKNIWIVLIVTFLLGAVVTMAEPSITILANQTPIPTMVFVIIISIGVGVFTAIGVYRIIKHKPFHLWLVAFYGLVFALILLVPNNSTFMPLIFDSGGATTGTATVPFLLAVGASVAAVRGGSKSKEDTFGLIGICSIGPLLSLVIMFIFNREGLGTYSYDAPVLGDSSIFKNFIVALFPHNGEYGNLLDVLISVSPLLIIFLVYQAIFIKLPKKEILKVVIGFIYVYFGLVIFLNGVNAAMMPIGSQIGLSLGNKSPWIIILVCFCIGLVSILCEPSTQVLTKQIKAISDGGISSFTVVLTLCFGVGAALALSAIRTIFNFSILYIIVPGFILAIVLSFFCPKLFTAMAFDSGGVASGPMCSSFVLPMIIGVCYTTGYNEGMEIAEIEAGLMQRGFGTIGLVALTPIIAVQILGIIIEIKKRRKEAINNALIFSPEDEQIIHFN